MFKFVKKIFKRKILMRREDVARLGVNIGHDCEIYDDVNFGSEPYLISIGDHVRITRGCKFVTHDGAVWVARKLYNKPNIDLVKPIVIKNNVHIGMNSIIMPGVTIGDNVIIGCGAVVTKNIPSGEIWGGVPARKISTVNEYYKKHFCEFIETKSMDCNEKKTYLINKFR